MANPRYAEIVPWAKYVGNSQVICPVIGKSMNQEMCNLYALGKAKAKLSPYCKVQLSQEGIRVVTSKTQQDVCLFSKRQIMSTGIAGSNHRLFGLYFQKNGHMELHVLFFKKSKYAKKTALVMSELFMQFASPVPSLSPFFGDNRRRIAEYREKRVDSESNNSTPSSSRSRRSSNGKLLVRNNSLYTDHAASLIAQCKTSGGEMQPDRELCFSVENDTVLNAQTSKKVKQPVKHLRFSLEDNLPLEMKCHTRQQEEKVPDNPSELIPREARQLQFHICKDEGLERRKKQTKVDLVCRAVGLEETLPKWEFSEEENQMSEDVFLFMEESTASSLKPNESERKTMGYLSPLLLARDETCFTITDQTKERRRQFSKEESLKEAGTESVGYVPMETTLNISRETVKNSQHIPVYVDSKPYKEGSSSSMEFKPGVSKPIEHVGHSKYWLMEFSRKNSKPSDEDSDYISMEPSPGVSKQSEYKSANSGYTLMEFVTKNPCGENSDYVTMEFSPKVLQPSAENSGYTSMAYSPKVLKPSAETSGYMSMECSANVSKPSADTSGYMSMEFKPKASEPSAEISGCVSMECSPKVLKTSTEFSVCMSMECSPKGSKPSAETSSCVSMELKPKVSLPSRIAAYAFARWSSLSSLPGKKRNSSSSTEYETTDTR